MFTYKKAPYKIFALGSKFCWAGPDAKKPDLATQWFIIGTSIEIDGVLSRGIQSNFTICFHDTIK